jgi:hypothetical protein
MLRDLFAAGNFAVGKFLIEDSPIDFRFYVDPPPRAQYRNKTKSPILDFDFDDEDPPNSHKTSFTIPSGQPATNLERSDYDGSGHPEYTRLPELMK